MSPAAPEPFDVIVIGGGAAGENAAQYAIQGSDRTAALIESELVGGECSYWACMPSKALLRPIEIRAAAAALPGTGLGSLDVSAILERRDVFTHHRDDASQVAWAEGAGITVVRGSARLTGERTVSVTDAEGATRELTARHAVVLATGSTPTIPPITGLAEARPWTSRDATNLVEVPGRVAVIGGGVVACESAMWFHGLGAEVTVIVRESVLLSGREPFVSELLAERFAGLGITVHLNAQVEAVDRPEVADTGVGHVHGGPLTLHLADATLEVDELVVAAGRRPATEGLGLDLVGVSPHPQRGHVEVDDHLTVAGTDWLYAVGDVNGRALLTHMGKYQGRIAGAVIAARADGRPIDGPRYRADGVVPGVIFTDPQIGQVGLTEDRARSQGIDVETLEYDLASVAGASVLRDDYAGRAKLVVDRASDLIVGATFMGPDTAELLHSATVAIAGKVTLEQLWHAVPSYPTVSEGWLRLLESRPVTAWQ